MVLVGLAFLASWARGGEDRSGGRAPIPVILDTDIGGDIDDTWALFFALRCPEIDVKLVTTDHGNTPERTRLLARLLEVAGRTDVPIGRGLQTGAGPLNQGEWIEGYDLSRYPGRIHEDGVQAFIDTIMASPEPVTVCATGPMPNLAAALEREPRIARKARFVGMHGSLRVGYGGKPEPDAEWNVRAAPAACRAVFRAPWDVTVTPLDTCGLVRLRGERFARIRESADPVLGALMENYRIWHRTARWAEEDPEIAERESSTLFDVVTVYLAFSEELLNMEDLGVRVRDDGFTVIDPAARSIRCATSWKDLDAFEELLVDRLTCASSR
jgi:inosine-uridine nucleoside N-ribohydrolase